MVAYMDAESQGEQWTSDRAALERIGQNYIRQRVINLNDRQRTICFEASAGRYLIFP
jgi:hypothetical protein